MESLPDRLTGWLVYHRRNPLRLPEEPTPAPGTKHELLDAAVRGGDVLLHGSNTSGIRTFEPREQTTYRDRVVRAVFATADPLWAMFFAVVDSRLAIGRWNACLRPEATGLPRSRYYFAVRGEPSTVWTEGTIYLLPRSSFEPSDAAAEWISSAPVEPLDAVTVTRGDFPFADRVFRFRHPESDWIRLARLLANARRA